MADTPKVPKNRNRTSLSLNKKLNRRLSSPKTRRRSAENSIDNHNSSILDANECTPPHKKFSLDNSILDSSLDFSPSSYEGCYSPSTLLSQTCGLEEPEVGWRWTKDDDKLSTVRNAVRGDSAHSSKNEATPSLRRTQSDSYRNRQAYLKKVNELRHAKEIEMYKAEKARAESVLRQRLSKLGEQLKDIKETKEVSKVTNDSHEEDEQYAEVPDNVENIFSDFDDTFGDIVNEKNDKDFSENKNASKYPGENDIKKVETINDFFNDSDTDCLLLEATQQVEATVSELTQKIPTPNSLSNSKIDSKKKSINAYDTNCNESHLKKSVNSTDKNRKGSLDSVSTLKSESSTTKLITGTTNKTHTSSIATPKNKEKRSSLYMNFLEEDDDDFFVSLDEDWLMKASQSNKSRSPFQRYKSMPASTTVTTTTANASKHTINNSGNTTNNCTKWSVQNGLSNKTATSTSNSLKRHSSSHAISPSTSTNLRGRHLHRRD